MQHMKRTLSLALLIFAVAAAALGQDFRTVHPGVEHADVTHRAAGDTFRIHLLRLDLTRVRLDVKLGMDTIVGTETTSSIARRHGAVAAINAGFFRFDGSIFAGDPVGLLRVDGVTLSESVNSRVAMMIENTARETRVHFDRADVSILLTTRGQEFTVGINRERRDNDIVIYTPEFGRTTLTDRTGAEFLVSAGRVTGVFNPHGSSVIPAGGYVISASGDKLPELLRLLTRNTRVEMTVRHSSPTDVVPTTVFGRAEDITNGVSRLVTAGKIDLTWEAERAIRTFAENRHPRTAVAKLRDGRFLMITVDGRQPGVSEGMTLQELAEYVITLGAIDAINLDGGGSTTMYLDGKVVNTPSNNDAVERKVSDAVIVTLR